MPATYTNHTWGPVSESEVTIEESSAIARAYPQDAVRKVKAFSRACTNCGAKSFAYVTQSEWTSEFKTCEQAAAKAAVVRE